VVEIAAATRGDDATRIHLECRLVCFDGNRDRAVLESTCQGAGRFAHILVASDTTAGDGCAEAALAGAIPAGVRVRRLSGNSVRLSPAESVVHEASIASRINFVAIHKLLLRHADKVAR